MQHRRRRAVGMIALATALLAEGLFLPASVGAIVDPPNARWKLDDASGATADDFIGTANGTVAGGATWLTSGAAVGTGALRLDGSNDFVSIPSSPAIEPAEATITLWVRGDPQHKPRNGDVVFEKGSFACNGPSYGLYVASTGFTGTFRAPNGQISTTTFDTAGVNVWDGGWHLIAMSFLFNPFGPQTWAGIWVDGGSAASLFNDQSPGQTTAIQYAGATHSELVIGGPVDPTCGKTTFKGDIDDVRLYDDPDTAGNTGSLMPPQTVTLSNLAAVQAHPGEQITTSVDVSPPPRWGSVEWRYYRQDGSAAGVCCSEGLNYIDNPTGHVSRSGLAPQLPGSYELRAVFTASAPYVSNSTSSTITVTAWPSTTTVSAAAGTHYPYAAFDLGATVTSTAIDGNANPSGSVKFWDTTPVTPVLLGTRTLVAGTTGTANATLTVNTLGGGTHKIKAEFVGDSIRAGSMSSALDVVITKETPNVYITSSDWNVEAGHPFVIAGIVEANAPAAPNATLTFRKVGVSTPICTLPVAGLRTECTVPGDAAGQPQYTVTYSGNADVAARTSDPFTMLIQPDTARAERVGVQYTSFYPYTDTYRDTNKISGDRIEPLSVTIKIYYPSGSLYKTVSFPSASGLYSYVWTGRTSTGTIMGEGQYKVVQTLTDATAHVKTVTSYVTLSKKHLVYYTKTISKLGSSITAQGTMGGTITRSTTYGYTKLSAPTGSWAGAGWELTMPSAAVYSWFYVRVYGRRSSGTGTVHVGAQQFTRTGCGYSTSTDWNEICFGSFGNIPVTSGTTKYYYRTPGLTSSYRSGTKVRLIVSTTGGTVYVYKAQVRVSYAVLSY